MRRGYERAQLEAREYNLEAWRRARLLLMPHVKEHTQIWDVLPLPGDPTLEERVAIRAEEVKKMESDAQKTLDFWKDKGYLTDITAQA